MQFEEREQNGLRRIEYTTKDILRRATKKCADSTKRQYENALWRLYIPIRRFKNFGNGSTYTSQVPFITIGGLPRWSHLLYIVL